MKSTIEWTRVEHGLPEFDATGWAHDLLFWDGDQLYSGSCRKRDGDPVFVDWWVGGCDSDAQWWAYQPEKPSEIPLPCPFCGKMPEYAGNGDGYLYACTNSDCASSGSWAFKGGDAKKHALELWNNRAG